MDLELYALLAATLLGLIHMAAASFAFKAQVGNAYSVGPRDAGIAPTGLAARLYRAQANFMETYVFFAVCVLLVHLTQSAGNFSQWGVWLYLVGRVLFLPLYASGVPWLRTLSWKMATLGLVLVGVQILV